jgi:deferrochelatase/peroxidase EfeB
MEYVRHTGSATFAVPGGVRDERDWWGRPLFA